MDATTEARIFGATRIAFGTALAAVPQIAAAQWIGDDANRPGTRVMCAAMGVRDAAIGAGLVMAAGSSAARNWLIAGIASDAVDLLATVRGESLPTAGRIGTTLIAAGAVIGGLRLLAQGD